MSLPREEFTFVAPLTVDTPPSADALETAVSVEPAPLGLVDESDGAIAYAPDLPPAAGEAGVVVEAAAVHHGHEAEINLDEILAHMLQIKAITPAEEWQ